MITTVALRGFNTLLRSLNSLPRLMELAQKRAIKRTADGTKTQAKRIISAKTKIPQKRLDRRLAVKVRNDGTGSTVVFVGTAPIPAGYVKPLKPAAMSPQEQRKLPGSYAGRRFYFPGAFVALMPAGKNRDGAGHLGIFIRKNPTTRRSKKGWSNNLPIQEMKLSLEALGVTGLEEQLMTYAEERLEKELRHELKWRLKNFDVG